MKANKSKSDISSLSRGTSGRTLLGREGVGPLGDYMSPLKIFGRFLRYEEKLRFGYYCHLLFLYLLKIHDTAEVLFHLRAYSIPGLITRSKYLSKRIASS